MNNAATGALIAVLLACAAGEQSPPAPVLDVRAIPSKGTYASGDTVVIALRVIVPDAYHLYGNPLGPGIGKPLRIGVSGGAGVRWLDILKPKAERYRPDFGDWVWTYEEKVFFFLRGIAGPAGEVKGKAILDALICHTACYPVHYEIPFVIRIGSNIGHERPFTSDITTASIFAGCTETMPFASSAQRDHPALSDSAGAAAVYSEKMPPGYYTPKKDTDSLNVWLAILLGFLAGVILNAMPCVLPVLGVKILSFAEGKGEDRRGAVARSLVFSAGVISVFMVFAGLAAFAGYSWGRQFQDPRALVAVITLIVVFALGMFDVYMITVPVSVAGLSGKNGGRWNDFFSGVFATVLATPCSGPFLGAVLAWLVMQPPVAIFIIYGSIGAGMAFPYVLLSASQRLARLIPKPGRWMRHFKKILGFLLLGFAAYLMRGLPAAMIVPTLLFCAAVALAVAVYGHGAPWGSSLARTSAAFFLALLIAGSGGFLSFAVVYHPFVSEAAADNNRNEDQIWRKFSAESLMAAHAAGRHAIVDFTANWCMNCQYNYFMVLTRRDVLDLIRKKNVLALKADMTLPDPVQDSLLHRLGSQSIPFLAVFPGDKPYEPIVMRDILTKRRVVRVLEQLK
jgi:thiol:disulfide interchange protein